MECCHVVRSPWLVRLPRLVEALCVDDGVQSGGLTLTLDGRTMADMIADGPEDDRHLRTIAAHTSAYITHVRRQLKHTLPKAIVHCLVKPPFNAYGLALLCEKLLHQVQCGSTGHNRGIFTIASQRIFVDRSSPRAGISFHAFVCYYTQYRHDSSGRRFV